MYGNEIIRHLLTEEGYEHAPYQDSLGFWTIGIGHKLGSDPPRWKTRLSDEKIRQLFFADLKFAEMGYDRLFGHLDIDDARKVALVSMIFQMGDGPKGVGGFDDTLAAIERGDWMSASCAALDSEWARRQTPNRAKRVSLILRTGIVVEEGGNYENQGFGLSVCGRLPARRRERLHGDSLSRSREEHRLFVHKRLSRENLAEK